MPRAIVNLLHPQANNVTSQAKEARYFPQIVGKYLNMTGSFPGREKESRASSFIKAKMKRSWNFKSRKLDDDFFPFTFEHKMG